MRSVGLSVWAYTSVSPLWSSGEQDAQAWAQCNACYMDIYCMSIAPLHCSIFGFEGSDAEDIVYVNWLNMVRAGVVALEYYTPETKKWRQVRGREDHIWEVLTLPALAILRTRTGPHAS